MKRVHEIEVFTAKEFCYRGLITTTYGTGSEFLGDNAWQRLNAHVYQSDIRVVVSLLNIVIVHIGRLVKSRIT